MITNGKFPKDSLELNRRHGVVIFKWMPDGVEAKY